MQTSNWRETAEKTATESRWIAQLSEGGAVADVALRQLFDRYHAGFLKIMAGRGLPPEVARDAMQGVWIDILKKADEFNRGVPPSRWIWGFVDIAVKDAKRKLPRRDRDLNSDDELVAREVEGALGKMGSTTPETARALNDIRRCVQNAFAAFRQRHAEEAWLLYARHVQDWTLEEIATNRSSTLRAATVFLSEARRKFRPLVAPCLDLRVD